MPAPPVQAAAPPPEPDIAIARAERRKAEAAKKKAAAEAEAEKLHTAADAKKAAARQAEAERTQRDQEARAAKAEDARLARLREESLKRMMAQAGAANGTAAQSAGPSKDYLARLGARIRANAFFPRNLSDNEPAVVEVTAGASGTIISVRLVKSSGHKDWDEAVLRAIDKTGTIERDSDGRVPPLLTIVFRPNE